MNTHPTLSAGEALDRLAEGNESFRTGLFAREMQCGHCQELLQGQHPFAAILCCSDSRVPPELLFGQGLGELFVVRNAGSVLDDVVVGSLEYAVEHLGVRLIVVLGHEKCGAVTAAVTAPGRADGHLGAIMRSIQPALDKVRGMDGDPIANTIDAHIVGTVASLRQEPLISGAMRHHGLRVIGMRYNLHDGALATIAD